MSLFRFFSISVSGLAFSGLAAAAGVAYISSSSGYMLHMSGNTAVTANWSGQAPINGFTGYGQIQMSNRCLTGRTGNQPLTWEACNGSDRSQKWSLENRTLKNEGGWCADVEGGRGGAGARVMAWNCNGQGNQKWGSHVAENYRTVAARISNPAIRATFERNASNAAPGAVISSTTGALVSPGGGSLVAAGGGNLVAAGGGNLVAAGGGN